MDMDDFIHPWPVIVQYVVVREKVHFKVMFTETCLHLICCVGQPPGHCSSHDRLTALRLINQPLQSFKYQHCFGTVTTSNILQ